MQRSNEGLGVASCVIGPSISQVFMKGSAEQHRGSSATKRPPTHVVRKLERERLLRKVNQLQGRLEELRDAKKQRVSETQLNQRRVLQKQLEAMLLHDAARLQQLSLAHVQSAVSSYVSAQDTVPHEFKICLSTDPSHRRETLVSLKRRKMFAAMAYITARARFLDAFRPSNESTRFVLDSGDYCFMHTDITPFDAARVSVRQVFDAVWSYFASVEMRVTDLLGDITTRDETNYELEGVQQSRYVSYLSCGIPLEANSVVSWDFTEHNDEFANGGPLGVFTEDFVDQDELHPYHPTECVRQDVTAVLTVREASRTRIDPETQTEIDEKVVVLTRACLAKLRHSEHSLPPLTQHALRTQLGSWGDVMMSAVLEQVYGSSG